MIVSHRHRFIFLKTRKTAGTSIEIALSQFCGPKDIITPLHPDDEELRAQLGFRGPQNYESKRLGKPAWNHMSATHVKTMIGDRKWNKYYRFAVERHPLDVVLSSRHLTGTNVGRKWNMGRFVRSSRLDKLARNHNIYRIGGEVAVHKVVRYENLTDDLTEVWRTIGLPLPPDLPRSKQMNRTKLTRAVFTPDDIEIVRAAFAPTIELMGYEL